MSKADPKLTWRDAIILTLGENDNHEMHYADDIWEYIKTNNLYKPDGSTPQNTVNRTLTDSKHLFESTESGVYKLTAAGLAEYDKLKKSAKYDVFKKKVSGHSIDSTDASSSKKSAKDPHVESYITKIKANHNIILHGAPGTGKTYLAKKIAHAMGATKENGQFEMVQFHPSYDYTDFVEGLRPKSDGKGNIVFERRDGVFKEFCKRAIKAVTKGATKGFAGVGIKVATTITSSTAFVSLFKAAWDSLIADLDNGVLKDLPNKDRGRSIKIQANKQDKNRIDFYTKGDELNTSHWATFSGILEIHNYFKSPSNINNVEDIRKVCKGSQTSTLWAIYNEVYNRANKLANTRISPVINEPPYEEDEKVFIFVIDEINRGDMSKIFGELFFSIDPGYRGIDGKINTQYQNMLKGSRDVFEEGFYIPKNVYIIGTMNDIDRSVESMDFAMRRRFQFIEVTAEQSAENMEISGRAKMCMTKLNNCIIEIGLSTAYQIGGSYFLKENGNKKVAITEDSEFEDLWSYRLNGLLREYLRGEVDADNKIKKLKEAYDKGWKDENAVESDAEQEYDASGDSIHE